MAGNAHGFLVRTPRDQGFPMESVTTTGAPNRVIRVQYRDSVRCIVGGGLVADSRPGQQQVFNRRSGTSVRINSHVVGGVCG